MKDFEITICKVLTECLCGVQAVYLFGSFGTPFEKETSDVDIAVLLSPMQSKSISSKEFWAVRSKLEQILRRDVDLINLRAANTVFCNEILKEARRICCPDLYASDVFEMLTMSFYQKLNEERAAILGEVTASGRIFA